MLLNQLDFQTLINSGINILELKKIEMIKEIYMLKLKWLYIEEEIQIDVLLVFEEKEISVYLESIKTSYYFTEEFRIEISNIIGMILKDISFIQKYRYLILYKKVILKCNPNYIVKNIEKYNRRLLDEGYLDKEADMIIEEVKNEISALKMPPFVATDIYFQKVVLYGYDGVKLSNLLHKLGYTKKPFSKSISFPNAICRFESHEIENLTHNREEEIVKIWFRILNKYEYSCEITFNG